MEEVNNLLEGFDFKEEKEVFKYALPAYLEEYSIIKPTNKGVEYTIYATKLTDLFTMLGTGEGLKVMVIKVDLLDNDMYTMNVRQNHFPTLRKPRKDKSYIDMVEYLNNYFTNNQDDVQMALQPM